MMETISHFSVVNYSTPVPGGRHTKVKFRAIQLVSESTHLWHLHEDTGSAKPMCLVVAWFGHGAQAGVELTV